MGNQEKSDKSPEPSDTDDSGDENSSEDDESWAYKTGKVVGLKKKESRPPLINLDELNKPSNFLYKTRDEELDASFEEASWWIGVLMDIQEFRKFIWTDKQEGESDTSVINADKFDKGRRKAIKFKVERNLRINQMQLDILDYYITTKGGYIAWLKLDPRMVAEMHKRAAKAALSEFRTANFVPKLARERKASIDGILMGYKKLNPHFRYLVRNDQRDLKVLIKRLSEGNSVPYRKMSLDVLERLSPLKTMIPEERPVSGKSADEADGYQAQGRRTRKSSFIPKETIYRNITSILNGFEVKNNQNGK